MSEVVTDTPEGPALAPMPDGGQRIASPHERAVQAILAKRSSAEALPAQQPGPAETAGAQPPGQEVAPQAEPERASAKEAKLLAELQKRERAAYEAKKRVEEFEAKSKAWEDTEARRKADPITALKELGYTYEDVTRGIVEGKYKPASAEQLAIDAQKSEVQVLREKLEAIEAERAQATREREMESRISDLASRLTSDEVAAQIPVLSALPWAARHLAEYYDANPDADLDAYALQLEEQAARDLKASLSSDRALKALLSDDATKQKVMAMLGVTKPQQQQPALRASVGAGRGNAPTAIPTAKATATGTRRTPSRVVADAERKQNAVRAIMARRSA